jgi:hypothetical protein
MGSNVFARSMADPSEFTLSRPAFSPRQIMSEALAHDGGVVRVYLDAFAKLQVAQSIGTNQSQWLQ